MWNFDKEHNVLIKKNKIIEFDDITNSILLFN
jgi:hypothetical protein